MDINKTIDAAKEIANPEKVFIVTSTIEEIEKSLNRATRSGVRRGYSTGMTHGALLGTAIGAVGFLTLRHVSVKVHVNDQVVDVAEKAKDAADQASNKLKDFKNSKDGTND